MDFESMGLAIVRVLLAGLLFGAGVPAVFAAGIRMWAKGHDEVLPDGSVRRGNRAALAGAAAALLVTVAMVVVGVLWITRKSLYHYLGISLFGMG
ncbi:hypothetical protein [Salana multivorans]|nr:hypothetical protein [Salana multivorans]